MVYRLGGGRAGGRRVVMRSQSEGSRERGGWKLGVILGGGDAEYGALTGRCGPV